MAARARRAWQGRSSAGRSPGGRGEDRGARRHVDRMLRCRRPVPFRAGPEDAALIGTAIDLLAAAPDPGRPREAFVVRLRERLAADPARASASRSRAGARSDPTRRRPGVPGRRQALRAGAVVALAFAVGTLVDRLARRALDTAPRDCRARITSARGAWHTVATVDDLPEGAVRDFDLGSFAGYVHRAQGRLRAVSATCTHQACRLVLDGRRTALVCPCHGATFTLAGDPGLPFRAGRPLPPLPRIPVREKGGRVQVWGPAPP